MRNIDENSATVERSMRLLNETANELKSGNKVEQKVQKLEQEIMLLRYTLSNLIKTIADYPRVKDQLDQLDYRTLGLLFALKEGPLKVTSNSDNTISMSNLDDLVESNAKSARDRAFWELSERDDKEKNLENADAEAAAEQSVVILTTECNDDPDQGVFRSKIDLGSQEYEQFKCLVGKRVGEKTSMSLMGKEHEVTILAIRSKPNADSKQQNPA